VAPSHWIQTPVPHPRLHRAVDGPSAVAAAVEKGGAVVDRSTNKPRGISKAVGNRAIENMWALENGVGRSYLLRHVAHPVGLLPIDVGIEHLLTAVRLLRRGRRVHAGLLLVRGLLGWHVLLVHAAKIRGLTAHLLRLLRAHHARPADLRAGGGVRDGVRAGGRVLRSALVLRGRVFSRHDVDEEVEHVALS